MYDLIIQNGTVLDGSGREGFRADLGIRDGRIAAIGTDLGAAREYLDATGLTVTPGFIDSHSHSDSTVLAFPDQTEKIEQGVTLSVGGQCGVSPAPLEEGTPSYPVGDFGESRKIYRTMGSFLSVLKQVPLGSGLGAFVGHGALRRAAMGSSDRDPTPAEQERMGELLREAMANGALGVSFGLFYAPGCFAKTREVIELARIAAEGGGLVSVHLRDEGARLLESCEEFIQVAKASGARVVFSHHKAMYRENWGLVKKSLALIDGAVADGAQLYLDTYPYTASHTKLSARFVPKAYHAGGTKKLLENLTDPVIRERILRENLERFGSEDDLSWVLIASCPAHPEFCGRRIPEIAAAWGKSAYDTVFDLIVDCKGECRGCFFLMSEEDLRTVLAHPRCMICTDAAVRGESEVYHPRLRGSFPRALGRYAGPEGVVSLAEMVRKMTSLPALMKWPCRHS
ncbi:MAG: amidohydrolase family protein, partial [Clostridia bacterium]|nr:amidohydrolase family protein [Clostridia bacterium]